MARDVALPSAWHFLRCWELPGRGCARRGLQTQPAPSSCPWSCGVHNKTAPAAAGPKLSPWGKLLWRLLGECRYKLFFIIIIIFSKSIIVELGSKFMVLQAFPTHPSVQHASERREASAEVERQEAKNKQKKQNKRKRGKISKIHRPQISGDVFKKIPAYKKKKKKINNIACIFFFPR